MSDLHARMSVPGTQVGQMKVSDLLNWSYRCFVSYHVGAGNRIQLLCKSNKCPSPLSHQSSTHGCFLFPLFLSLILPIFIFLGGD